MDDPINAQRDETPVSFFNPLKEDVVVEVYGDNNIKGTVVLKASELATHPKWLADVLKKHLVDAIINSRGLGYTTPEKRQEIYQEIET